MTVVAFLKGELSESYGPHRCVIRARNSRVICLIRIEVIILLDPARDGRKAKVRVFSQSSSQTLPAVENPYEESIPRKAPIL